MARTISIVAIVAAAGALAGCGGGGHGQTAAQRSTEIQLQEQNGSGESGLVDLIPLGDRTKVVIRMQSGPTTHQPAHIHSGTCAKLDPTPAYQLNDIVSGRSTTIVDASLASLEAKPYAINVHKSPLDKDLSAYVACGEIGENSAPAATYTNAGD